MPEKTERYVNTNLLFDPFIFGFRKCSDYLEFSFIEKDYPDTLFRLEEFEGGVFRLFLMEWEKETSHINVFEEQWIYGNAYLEEKELLDTSVAMRLQNFYISAESVEAKEEFDRLGNPYPKEII